MNDFQIIFSLPITLFIFTCIYNCVPFENRSFLSIYSNLRLLNVNAFFRGKTFFMKHKMLGMIKLPLKANYLSSLVSGHP